ncbi:MAG: 23S rRNA (pseudouridine(1915)-N(3))-methyltransferase RlmH [Odoribacter sp.]|nr:23S rRNA (pseudouridine(1915)-N(3))-methyltransferase RlmH [Odoribacter sp.]
MKVCLLVIGKTDASYIREEIAEYEKRLTRYIPYEMKVLPDVKNAKNLTESLQKEREGEMLLEQFQPGDFVVLLDERGRQYSSMEFSQFLAQKMLGTVKRLVFVVGGPYGFSDGVYKRANDKISLSKMTFSHQMVRMIFAEQIYRAMTILKGEPYHHE